MLKIARTTAGLFCALLAHSISARAEVNPSAYNLMQTYTDARPYKSVAWLTAHNAFASENEGWKYAQQKMNIKEQFDYGVRSFMVDVHEYTPLGGHSYLALCHNTCPNSGTIGAYLPSGLISKNMPQPFVDFLTEIGGLLAANTQDVITLHVESYTKRNSPLSLSGDFTSAGINPYLLHLVGRGVDPNDQNITLGSLRNTGSVYSGKRLVVFSDKTHDAVFYVSNYRETQYSLSTYKSCQMRGHGRSPHGQTARGAKDLFVFNHFYPASFDTQSLGFGSINSFEYIKDRLEDCHLQEGVYPTFVAVDYVEQGNGGGAREAVLWLNYKSLGTTLPQKSSVLLGSTQLQTTGRLSSFKPDIAYGGYAVSAACGVGSFFFPWMIWPAAILGSTSTILLMDNHLGEYVPSTYSSGVYAAGGIASLAVFYSLHPAYWVATGTAMLVAKIRNNLNRNLAIGNALAHKKKKKK